MKFKVKEAQGVPPGIYENAIFEGCEPVAANPERGFKPAWLFKFRVTEGTQAGALASRIPNGEEPTLKNALGRFLGELTGIAPTPNADYDIEPLIGLPFTIVVKEVIREDGSKGGTRVDTVIPAKR